LTEPEGKFSIWDYQGVGRPALGVSRQEAVR